MQLLFHSLGQSSAQPPGQKFCTGHRPQGQLRTLQSFTYRVKLLKIEDNFIFVQSNLKKLQVLPLMRHAGSTVPIKSLDTGSVLRTEELKFSQLKY